MNRKRCGDGAELSYVGYARVNSSVFSLALKVPRVPAVLLFIYQWLFWNQLTVVKLTVVSWFQTVGVATQKARDDTEMGVDRG